MAGWRRLEGWGGHVGENGGVVGIGHVAHLGDGLGRLVGQIYLLSFGHVTESIKATTAVVLSGHCNAREKRPQQQLINPQTQIHSQTIDDSLTHNLPSSSPTNKQVYSV